MNLTVNGKAASVAETATLSVNGLLDALNVAQKEYVTVEVNGDIVERELFSTTTVKDGDTVEFLYFMGGGAQ
ncbi:thiamine biosynthesis protein ThiS [Geomonas limicola]|uniref:Thiamine biosynthesis protein ThiS n=1 Tax=Geomonas limicola TaxID=2740186 RepID=A0A6V8N9X6_9BACT|nr:sulfur carrier protein ThiS [Geomonas limicola]GFO69250.1 thiamine biosynthesis protein ThiS [Geomonas limicola]